MQTANRKPKPQNQNPKPQTLNLKPQTPNPHPFPPPGTADQNFYPESLYKLFVVNTPALISVAWKIISPWVDARTKAKIVFLKPHETAAELLRHIDEEHLPVDLGGKCACEGGCLMDETSGEEDGFTTESVKVKKGAKTSKTVAIAPNQMICWDFVVEAHDVGFRALVGDKNIAEGATQLTFARCVCSNSRIIHVKN